MQILNNDQSWIFVKKRFPCTSEMHNCLLRFFFGTTKKVWPAISITELQKASRVAPIPAGRRRGVVARELADRLLELATRYIYACDFRPETCSILLQHLILREWNGVLSVFNRQKLRNWVLGGKIGDIPSTVSVNVFGSNEVQGVANPLRLTYAVCKIVDPASKCIGACHWSKWTTPTCIIRRNQFWQRNQFWRLNKFWRHNEFWQRNEFWRRKYFLGGIRAFDNGISFDGIISSDGIMSFDNGMVTA